MMRYAAAQALTASLRHRSAATSQSTFTTLAAPLAMPLRAFATSSNDSSDLNQKDDPLDHNNFDKAPSERHRRRLVYSVIMAVVFITYPIMYLHGVSTTETDTQHFRGLGKARLDSKKKKSKEQAEAPSEESS